MHICGDLSYFWYSPKYLPLNIVWETLKIKWTIAILFISVRLLGYPTIQLQETVRPSYGQTRDHWKSIVHFGFTYSPSVQFNWARAMGAELVWNQAGIFHHHVKFHCEGQCVSRHQPYFALIPPVLNGCCNRHSAECLTDNRHMNSTKSMPSSKCLKFTFSLIPYKRWTNLDNPLYEWLRLRASNPIAFQEIFREWPPPPPRGETPLITSFSPSTTPATNSMIVVLFY